MKRGGCKFGDGKTRGCPWLKGGAVVFKLVPKSQYPPPPSRGWGVGEAYPEPGGGFFEVCGSRANSRVFSVYFTAAYYSC